MSKNFKNKLRAAAVAACIALASMSAHADITSAMNDAFNSMSNFTQPGVFDTQRRGVISGGSYYEREPVVSTDILSLQLPSVRAGCGGIDFFGGSFSFINADQFVQLLRAVAANAKGYAFQIALEYASPSIANTINYLQSIIQKMNDAFGNSCRLAEGIVTGSTKALEADIRNRSSISGTISGLFSDIGSAFTRSEGTDPVAEQNNLPQSEKDKFVGNVVWQQLKNHNVSRLLLSATNNEEEEYEQIMSITGTAVINDPTDSGDGEQSNPVTPYPPLITLDDLVEGSDNVSVYQCRDADDGCKNLGHTTETIPSLKDMVRRALVGEPGNNGVISEGLVGKFSRAQNNQLTQVEANVSANLLPGAAAMLRNLSINNPQSALQMADDFSYAIAMDWGYDYIHDIILLARQAASVSQSPKSQDVVDQMDKAMVRLNESYIRLTTKYPSYVKLTDTYSKIMRIMRLPDMIVTKAEGKEAKVNP